MKATAMWAVAATAGLASVMAPQAARAELGHGGGKRTVNYQTLEQGHDGLWCKPAVVAVRSAADWDAAMQKLAAEGCLMALPAPAAPQVDWSRWTVVLVSMGNQLERGAGLSVTEARAAGRNLSLEVALQAPYGGMSGDPYAPYLLVAVESATPLGPKSVQLNYTLQTEGGSMAGGTDLPAEVAVQYGTQSGDESVATSWGRMKAEYR